MPISPVVLPIGTTGLVKADFSFRLYRDGVLDTQDVVASDLTVTEISGSDGDYLISGLPVVGVGSWFTLTYEQPPGVGGSFVYPTHQLSAPPNAVIPVRDTGLVTADFDLTLYKDGVEQPDVLTAAELVTGGGDYLISGWPTDEAGTWRLVYRLNGISFTYDWIVSEASVSETCQLINDLSDMFPELLLAQPITVNHTGDTTNTGTVRSLPCYYEGESRVVRDMEGREVVSSLTAIVAGHFNLNPYGYRYTLPARFAPNTSLMAIRVVKWSDELGACYEEVVFP